MSILHDQLVDITRDYLGPAAERFVDRQINFHLKKNPQDLAKEDIPKLSEWIKVTLATLTQDVKSVNDCSQRISSLAL